VHGRNGRVCLCEGGWTASGSRSPAGCGLEVDEPWRLGEVERLEDGPLAVRRLGALAAGAGGTAERAEVHAVKLVAQVEGITT
jgi:hypothetical protein